MKSKSEKNITGVISTSFKLSAIVALIIALVFFVASGNFSFQSFLKYLTISAVYSYGLGFVQGIINHVLNIRWNWVHNTKKRVLIGALVTLVYTSLAILAIHYILYVLIGGTSIDEFLKSPMLFTHLFAFVLSIAISMFFHARGFMLAWKDAVKQETTAQKIVAKTETAKFETLKSQLDPHFLFNSLNVLTSLISENPNSAEKFTTKLSKVYRYVLEQRNKDLVPVQEELNFAKLYMDLLQMRFEDALTYELPSQISSSDLKLVPLSLQILLENAVKHNVVSVNKPLHIIIKEESGNLIVQNNYNPKEVLEKSTKVGLQNIADRYGLISYQSIEIVNDKKTFTVSLPLLTKINNMIKTSENIEDSIYYKALERVEKIKEFYKSLITFAFVIPFLIFINLKYSSHFHWFWFPMLGWGIGLFFQGLSAYKKNIFLGSDWEERKIKEFMNNQNR